MELNLYLFSLFLHEYDDSFDALYTLPVYSYLLDSLARFSELLFKAHTFPQTIKAPPVLNMQFSDYGGGM